MSSSQLVLAASSVSSQQKLLAAVIGVAVIVLLYVISSVATNNWRPLKVIEGQDGTWSTSKFQWFVWLLIILFSYVFLWFIRTREGDYTAITDVPANLLTVLGFSTATAIGAKGITVGYLKAGSITKANPAQTTGGNGGSGDSAADTSSAAGASSSSDTSSSSTSKGGLLVDDSGSPELAKIQMIGFTIVAVIIFLYTVFHQVRGAHPTTTLPNIDSSLLVLMGISQGGYIGKKLVTLTTPFINAVKPLEQYVGGAVTITGASFGPGTGSSRLVLDGNPIKTESWTDTQIAFNVPDYYPVSGVQDWPKVATTVRLGIDLGGGTRGNEATLTVKPNPPADDTQTGDQTQTGDDASKGAGTGD